MSPQGVGDREGGQGEPGAGGSEESHWWVLSVTCLGGEVAVGTGVWEGRVQRIQSREGPWGRGRHVSHTEGILSDERRCPGVDSPAVGHRTRKVSVVTPVLRLKIRGSKKGPREFRSLVTHRES